jgi:hypothetical protein
MIVFDASGSMAGNVGQGIGTTIPRIDEVRASALRNVHYRGMTRTGRDVG